MSNTEFDVSGALDGASDQRGLNRLLRGAATYTVVSVLQRAAGFIMLPVYADVLDPSDYGTIAILLTIAGAMQLLLSFGLETAVYRGFFLHKSPDDRQLFLNTLGWFSVISPLVIIGPLFLVALATDGLGLAPPSYIGLELLAAALTVGALTVPVSYVRAKEDLRAYVKIVASSTVVLVVSKALFVLGFGWGVAGWVLSDVCGGAAMLAAALAFSGHRWEARLSRPMLKAALVLAVPLLPHLTAHWLLGLSDRLILGATVPAQEVGLYAMGYQFGVILGVVFVEANREIIPMYGRAIHSHAERDVLGSVASVQIGATVLLGGLVASIGPTFVHTVLPESYHGAATVVPAIALGYVLLGLYLVPMNVVSLMAGETSFVFIPTVVAGTLNVVLNLLLVGRHGIQAAAVNTAVGYGILLLLITIYYRRRTHIRLRLDWSRIVVPTVALIGVAALFCRLAVESTGIAAMAIEAAAFMPALLCLLTRAKAVWPPPVPVGSAGI